MRNTLLKLMAASVLLSALVFASWSVLRDAEPSAPAPLDAKREEAARAQEIVESVKQGHVGQARALADSFYRQFPNSAEIQRLERLTGYHPRPYGP
jgi:hypothetical protein